MRKSLVLLGCTALAACGGGNGAGPTTVGGSALTSSNPNADPGPGTGVSFTTDTSDTGTTPTTGTATTFLSGLTQPKTFNVIGGFQSLSVLPGDANTTYTTTLSDGTVQTTVYPETETYKGDATTVQSPAGSITYDPRSGIFTLNITDTNAGISNSFAYQDPAHRTDPAFTQSGTPNLAGFNYLEAGSGTDATTFFYQRPGESTTYVSLAGYVHNVTPSGGTQTFERGAFVIGTPTVASQVPTSGTGSYTGGMLATMVDEPYQTSRQDTFFQWIAGQSKVDVNFGSGAVSVALSGTVGPVTSQTDTLDHIPTITPTPVNPPISAPPTIAAGSTFTASGTGTISSVFAGGFSGHFSSASFTNGATTTAVDFSAPAPGSSTAGASSIDGSFYGPNAVNVGGSFRITGGVPSQRVDILGAFTGAKH
ncbi:MAG: hypothetical protein JOY99_11700 [Sphingomonadaceae bacterium]|nr:hypothetical protein [Sphingomonadaceae bacterium]